MEQTTNFTQNIDSLFSNLEQFSRNESVLGKPLTHEGKTFIPVISVTVGYGSGNSASKNQQTTSIPAGGMGMGALGLGAKICTDAVVLIDNNNVTMLPVNSKAGSMMDKLPQMLSNLNLGGQNSNQNQNQNQSQSQGQNQYNDPQTPQ